MIPFATASTRRCRRRAQLKFLLAIGTFAWLDLSARHASALEASADDRVTRAQALFDAGRALLKQGRAEQACPKLEESQRLDPGMGTQFNLADCYERVGKLASARALFLRVAETARSRGQQQRQRIALERASALEPRLSKLVVAVPPLQTGELRVECDGQELRRAQWNVPLPVDPGLHRVRASGPGIEAWSAEVRVAGDGAVQEVAVVVNEAGSFLDPLHRKIGLAAGGIGVAGIVVGSIFGVRAITSKNQAARAGCDGRECDSPESAALRERARSAGDVASVAMAVGAAGVAAAAVLLWVVPEPSPERVDDAQPEATLHVSPGVLAGGGALWLRGSF